MKKLIALVSLTMLGTSCAIAQDAPKAQTTTAQFVGFCQNKANAAEQNFCHGFGQGVYETYLITRHPKNAPAFVCMSSPAPTRQEAIDAFVKWSTANQQFNQASAADTILRYLGQTYPCK
jgi:hypothetical protein